MNIAFIHDRIFHIGGAEQIFFELIEKRIKKGDMRYENLGKQSLSTNHQDTYRIYTLFSDKTGIAINNMRIPIITALPRTLNDIFVWGSRKNIGLLDYRNLFIFHPMLCWLLKRRIIRYGAQEVIISSFAAVKNIVPPIGSHTGNVYAHVSLYLHSPNQYIRENYQEYTKKLTGRKQRLFKAITPALRKRDRKPRQYDTITTNSKYTAQCAKKYYPDSTAGTKNIPLKDIPIKKKSPRREEMDHGSVSTDGQSMIHDHIDEKKDVKNHIIHTENIQVSYPTLDPLFFSTPLSSRPRNYFLYIGRLTSLVREVDLIIKLCNTLSVPLIVAGSGPDREHLKSLAGPTITFVGRISDIEEKIELIRHARGLINLAKESCGIATMEALALGVPVFGYSVGGTAELVGEGMGLLTDSKEFDILKEKFEEFMEMEFEKEKTRQNMQNNYDYYSI